MWYVPRLNLSSNRCLLSLSMCHCQYLHQMKHRKMHCHWFWNTWFTWKDDWRKHETTYQEIWVFPAFAAVLCVLTFKLKWEGFEFKPWRRKVKGDTSRSIMIRRCCSPHGGRVCATEVKSKWNFNWNWNYIKWEVIYVLFFPLDLKKEMVLGPNMKH